MTWHLSHRADRRALELADRHYSRQKPGTPQFVPPGRCLVLYAPEGALWVTSWPFAEFTRHRWAGAWMCSLFRNESSLRASDLIREAVAVTRWQWPEVPELGMVTFIDPQRVRPFRRRGCAPSWGRTYELAGFEACGKTKGGLLAFQLTPERMPGPSQPAGLLGLDAPRVARERVRNTPLPLFVPDAPDAQSALALEVA